MSPRVRKQAPAVRRAHPPDQLRRLIETAMDFERRTMRLYCRFESRFAEPAEVRRFWFDMAQHESNHFGALALVAALLDETPGRALASVPSLTRAHVERVRTQLDRIETEAAGGVTLPRALALALEVECSEIEDLVLDLLTAFKGSVERERAVKLLIHDLGDLSYMIEKYTTDQTLLARADHVIECEVSRLRGRAAPRTRAPRTAKRKAR